MNKKELKKFSQPILVEENLYQLGPDYYMIVKEKGTKNGRKKFREYVIGNKTEARARKNSFLAEIEKQDISNIDKKNITFFEFCEHYFIPYCYEEGHSPPTIYRYKRNLNDVMNDLGNLTFKKIDRLLLQKVISKVKNRKKKTPSKRTDTDKISSTYANDIYRTLRNALNRAVDWDFIEYNPLLRIKCPPIDTPEQESYNKAELFEIIKLLHNHQKKYAAMFILEICTGIRRSEILGVHLNDFDFEYESINYLGDKEIIGKVEIKRSAVWDDVKKQMVEVKTKTPKSKRISYLPSFCATIIKDYIETDREDEIEKIKRVYGNNTPIANNLFLGQKGGIMNRNAPTDNWSRIRDEHSLKHVTLHGLRHSYCTLQRYENKELSDELVQKLLGHSSGKMTDHYSHLDREKIGSNVVSVFNELDFDIDEEITHEDEKEDDMEMCM